MDKQVSDKASDSKAVLGGYYHGSVTRMEPSLDAAFVDIGALRHGFLTLDKVPASHQPLKEGMRLIVQVVEGEVDNKGVVLDAMQQDISEENIRILRQKQTQTPVKAKPRMTVFAAAVVAIITLVIFLN